MHGAVQQSSNPAILPTLLPTGAYTVGSHRVILVVNRLLVLRANPTNECTPKALTCESLRINLDREESTKQCIFHGFEISLSTYHY
jgi:hypothetical protein